MEDIFATQGVSIGFARNVTRKRGHAHQEEYPYDHKGSYSDRSVFLKDGRLWSTVVWLQSGWKRTGLNRTLMR